MSKDFENRVGRVLAVANRNPVNRRMFYGLKTWILENYGKADGNDFQLIVKPCWGEFRRDCDDTCRNCGGTGEYSRRTVILERYRLGDSLFHIPRGTIVGAVPTIEGLIHHRPSWAQPVAALALALTFSPALYMTWLQCTPERCFGRRVSRASQVARYIAIGREPWHESLPLIGQSSVSYFFDQSEAPF